MLRIEDVSRRYGKTTVLDSITLSLEKGHVTAVVGENGAGKTTLIKSVVGLIKYEGTITVGGFDVAREGKKARRMVGYLPQLPAFHGDLTVRETALFYAGLKDVAGPAAHSLVEKVGLVDHAEKKVSALSGGMRQRLGLAIALLADPPILLLDEPAASLDTKARLELRELVKDQRQAGKAVLLSTHWIEDVPYVADEALVLNHGKAAFQGPASALAESGVSGSRLFLRLNGSSPEAVSVLKSTTSASDITRSGDWVILTCVAADKARVVEALVRSGIHILDFRVEEASIDTDALKVHATDGARQ